MPVVLFSFEVAVAPLIGANVTGCPTREVLVDNIPTGLTQAKTTVKLPITAQSLLPRSCLLISLQAFAYWTER